MRFGRDDDAKKLLERCLELAPGFMPARYQLRRRSCTGRTTRAGALRRDRAPARRRPAQSELPQSAAVILSRVGEYERSSRIYAELLDEYPTNAKVWLSYGHVLKTEGRQDESIDGLPPVHRAAIPPSARPTGASPISRPSASPRPTSRRCAQASMTRAVDDANRVHFHFALGKALEDAGDYATSFEHYAKGNALYRAQHPLRRGPEHKRVERAEGIFTREFFDERAGRAAAPRRIRSSSSACRVRARRCSSRSSPAIRRSKERASCPSIITMAKELRAQSESEEIGAYAEVLARHEPAGAAGARRALPGAHANPPQDRPPVLHRQDAEQLPARRR